MNDNPELERPRFTNRAWEPEYMKQVFTDCWLPEKIGWPEQVPLDIFEILFGKVF